MFYTRFHEQSRYLSHGNQFSQHYLKTVLSEIREAAREQGKCLICAKYRDPITGELRFNAETLTPREMTTASALYPAFTWCWAGSFAQ